MQPTLLHRAAEIAGGILALCEYLGADITSIDEAQSLAITEAKVLSGIGRLVAHRRRG